jgi:undecaprenyl-diphosphatase
VSFFASIFYGLVSGLTEIFPVSAQANQMVMRQIFGVAQKEPIRDLLVHLAVIIAVFLACRGMFGKIRREQTMAYRMRRNPSQIRALKGVYDMRLVRTAAPIMMAGMLVNLFFRDFYSNRILFALMLLLNGAMTLVPTYMHQGNRDARTLHRADGLLIGFAAALSAIPGISRNGAIMFMTLMRKADKQNGVTWSLLLTVPALFVLLVLDFISIFTVGVGAVTIGVLGGYMVSMLAAFAGAFLAVNMIKVLVLRSDYSGFAYYDFGLALLTLILYLIA